MSANIVHSACAAHIGKREDYEDNFYLNDITLSASDHQSIAKGDLLCAMSRSDTKLPAIFAISDGMGGHENGQQASRICIEMLEKNFSSITASQSEEELIQELQSVIDQANQAVCSLAKQPGQSGKSKAPGATFVIAALWKSRAIILNVGDSRAYRIEAGSIRQITKDNTEGQRLLDLGILSRKELPGFPARKNLNRYIGFDRQGFILNGDVYQLDFQNGALLLCSDGVTDSLSDSQILEIIQDQTSSGKAVRKLVSEAVKPDGADNTTALLICLKED